MNSDGISGIEKEIKKEELRKVVEGHTYNPTLIKNEYKKQCKSFQKDNEDVLFYHNTAQQFRVASIEEFLHSTR